MSAPDQPSLVAAVLGVDGVAGAAIETDEHAPGAPALRLRLVEGADEAWVAHEVARLLRTNFHLGIDPDRVQVVNGGRRAMPPPTVLRSAPPLPPRHAAEGLGSEPPRAPTGDIGSSTTQGDPMVADVTQADVTQGDATQGVALQDDAAAPEPARRGMHAAGPDRLSIERVQMVSRGMVLVATVDLALRERVFTGEAEGNGTSSGIRRSLASATLRAVEGAVEGRARFEPEYVEISRSGDEETAFAVITMMTGRASERLAGAAVVREDVGHAVIRSVLAAVNRRLTSLLSSA